jgi:hypothetical protein
MNKSNLPINKNTRLSEDKCSIDILNSDNKILLNHNFQSYLASTDNTRQEYFKSMDQPSLFQSGNFSGYKNNIDNGSSIKNGKFGNILTHGKDKRIFDMNNYITPPYKGPKTMALDPNEMSRLLTGELTQDKLSTRGKSIDRFVPLIPEIQTEIQNPIHYIPQYWVHGGMDTRVVIRNSDYRSMCGKKEPALNKCK